MINEKLNNQMNDVLNELDKKAETKRVDLLEMKLFGFASR
jgi:hypothetical protein